MCDDRELLPADDATFAELADELEASDLLDLLDAGVNEIEATAMVAAAREAWQQQWTAALAQVRRRLVN